MKQSLLRLLTGFSNSEEKKDLRHYKNEAFYRISLLFISIGLLPICYGAFMFFKDNNVIAGLLEILFYLVILISLLSKRISITKKKYIFISCIFLLGLMLLFIVGPLGSGLIVMFSAFGLAAFLLNRKQNILFIYISLFTFIVISVLLYLGLLDRLAISLYKDSWYIVAISTQCLVMLFVLIINNLFDSIENQIEEIEKNSKTTTESERSKSVLLSNLPGMAYRCHYDRDWTMQFVSDGCMNLTGYPPESLINNKEVSFNTLITSVYREPLWREWERIITEKLPFKYEYEITTAGGEHKWVLEMGEVIYDEQKQVEALEGIILDISEKKKYEEETKQLLARTHSMINDHDTVMLLFELETLKIIEANPAASSFYGYSKEELLSMTTRQINAMNKEEAAEMLLRAVNKGQRFSAVPHRLKSGELRLVDVYSSPIEYDNRIVIFSIIIDVTEREKIAKENEFLAYHDYLTGLYNRRFLADEFSRRTVNKEYPITLFLGDIDGFKTFNDTLGQAAGDKVLKEIATTLQGLIDQGDMLARIGGDEFAILVSGKNEEEVSQYLVMLNNEFDQDNSPQNSTLASVSWGYGIQTSEQDTLDQIREKAETLMNNRKFYNQKSKRSKMVDVIMETLFIKSEREKRHSERVGRLCEGIARAMRLSKSEIDKVRVAGFLHDIGKIGIEEAVLNKPGKLDNQEWEIMKLHPSKSAEILIKTKEYNDIAEIVLFHHERMDGYGYPGGFSGDEIPMMARIVAVCDAYDAMTEQRIYRKPLSKEEAIAELKRCSGTQFDSRIVDLFVNQFLADNEDFG